jgi:hypothetical protein
VRDVAVFCEGLGVSRGEFLARYCREVLINGARRLSLKEKPGFDCIFWEAGGCSVYARRPLQCRSHPFWPGNLVSRRRWEAVGASCPGIGRGELHGREEIEGWLRMREEDLLIDLNRLVDEGGFTDRDFL